MGKCSLMEVGGKSEGMEVEVYPSQYILGSFWVSSYETKASKFALHIVCLSAKSFSTVNFSILFSASMIAFSLFWELLVACATRLQPGRMPSLWTYRQARFVCFGFHSSGLVIAIWKFRVERSRTGPFFEMEMMSTQVTLL